jgi:hypothetical protein
MPRATKKRVYECMTASGERNKLRIRISKDGNGKGKVHPRTNSGYVFLKMVKVMLKFTLEQATKFQRGSRDTAVLFL